MTGIFVSSEAQAAEADVIAIENAIHTFNKAAMNDWEYIPIRIFLRDKEHSLLGGIVGGIWGGWFHINALWVTEHLRRQGYGKQLLEAAEAEARSHNCQHAYLETHSFQAPKFYQRQGYVIAGHIDNYPPGHSYYLLRKRL